MELEAGKGFDPTRPRVLLSAPKSLEPSVTDEGAPQSTIRVIRLFSRLNIGGPSLHVILLTAGLNGRGYQTRLFVGEEGSGEGNLIDEARERGVSVERVTTLGREIRPLADLWSVYALYRVMSDYRPHVVHTHTSKAGFVGRVAARLAGVPVIVHTYHGHVLRGYFGHLSTRIFLAVERHLGKATRALVAVSEAVRADLVAFNVAPAHKIRVIPLGLDLSRLSGALPRGVLRGELGLPDGALVVGIVGRLAPIKDVGTFLRAAALVSKRLPSARFVIAGDGPDRGALQADCARLGLAGVVHFLGWRRDLPALYGDLDVVVNCSLNEGTPVALIEALAAGRAVVATRVGGTPDLLRGERFGRLVEPRHPEALAEAIGSALENRVESLCRASRGREEVLTRYAIERLVDDVDGLYRELLSPRPVSAA